MRLEATFHRPWTRLRMHWNSQIITRNYLSGTVIPTVSTDEFGQWSISLSQFQVVKATTTAVHVMEHEVTKRKLYAVPLWGGDLPHAVEIRVKGSWVVGALYQAMRVCQSLTAICNREWIMPVTVKNLEFLKFCYLHGMSQSKSWKRRAGKVGGLGTMTTAPTLNSSINTWNSGSHAQPNKWVLSMLENLLFVL